MAAGLAQLRILRDEDPYADLERRTARLVEGILGAARSVGVPATGGNAGSMWGVFFTEGPVRCFADAQRSDLDLFRRYYHGCLRRGIFFAPSALEAGFLSTAHQDADIDETVARAAEALRDALA
jgi:glutamate-1-semialdehyde 2,1-aminomutase